MPSCSPTPISAPTAARRLPDAVYAALRDADVVLHCGDVVERGAPRRAGDVRAGARGARQQRRERFAARCPSGSLVELDGVRVGMVHDSGPTKGRPARMRRAVPRLRRSCVFGHSHAPVDEPGVDGQRLFNPGSPTQRRRMQPHPSFGDARPRGRRDRRPPASSLGECDYQSSSVYLSVPKSVWMNGPVHTWLARPLSSMAWPILA